MKIRGIELKKFIDSRGIKTRWIILKANAAGLKFDQPYMSHIMSGKASISAKYRSGIRWALVELGVSADDVAAIECLREPVRDAVI